MNSRQKKVAIVAIVIYSLTLLFAPFELRHADGKLETRHRPIFLPPQPEMTITERRVAPSLLYTWVGLGILCYGFHQVLRQNARPSGRGGGDGRPRPQGGGGYRGRRPANKS